MPSGVAEAQPSPFAYRAAWLAAFTPPLETWIERQGDDVYLRSVLFRCCPTAKEVRPIAVDLLRVLGPLSFPAGIAIAVLGLSAVHMRVPVRGLRIVAAVYLAIYALLLVLAFTSAGSFDGWSYVLAPDAGHHSVLLLLLRGLAFLAAATLFQRAALGNPDLVSWLDVAGVAIRAVGLELFLVPDASLWLVPPSAI